MYRRNSSNHLLPMPRLYVYHPLSHYSRIDYEPWLTELSDAFTNDPDWADWDLKTFAYQGSSFRINDLRSRVGVAPGAVLFLEPVDSQAVGEFRRLRPLIPVVRANVGSSAELQMISQTLREQQRCGEPRLPRRLVVAILIIRKLLNRNFWSGNHSYLKGDDLRKGGYPVALLAAVEDVANLLLIQKILQIKTKKGKGTKWALNSDSSMRKTIMALGEGRVLDPNLMAVFNRDRLTESALLVMKPDKIREFRISTSATTRQTCTSTALAIEILKRIERQSEGEMFICEVVFDDDRSLVEENRNLDHIVRFLLVYAE